MDSKVPPQPPHNPECNQRRRFVVISGGLSDRTTAVHLQHFGDVAPTIPQQLSLPFLLQVPKPNIVSVGFDACTFPEFMKIIRIFGVKAIVDVRLSPSFSSNGFQRDRVFNEFNSLGVIYRHEPMLGNRFLAEFWDVEAGLQRFREHLETNPDCFGGLIQLLGDQPVLLLGRAQGHHQSERGVILQTFQRVYRGKISYLAAEDISRLITSAQPSGEFARPSEL